MPNNKIIDLDRLSRFKEKLDIELDKKANVDGNYPTMTVGSADSLTPYGENSGAEDNTPFVFQSTGGSSDVGSKAYLKSLRGNSVAFNQLKTHGNFDVDSGWAVENATKSVSNNIMTVTASGTNQVSLYTNNIAMSNAHKYYLRFTLKNSNTGHLRISLLDGSTYSEKITIQSNIELDTTKQTKEYIFTSNLQGNGRIFVYTYLSTDISGGETTQFENFNLIDLTLMFGAGNEPTSVLEFNRLFPKSYYPYNAGTLLSCKSNGYKTVGYNAFDGQWQDGSLDTTTGEEIANVNRSRSDFIKVVAGQTYSLGQTTQSGITGSVKYLYEYDGNKDFVKYTEIYQSNPNWEETPITLLNNTQYVRIVYPRARINENQRLHLTWDGSRTGYEPYESETYPLPNVELRRNPATGTYDELQPNGLKITRVAFKDLSTITNWYYDTGNGVWVSNQLSGTFVADDSVAFGVTSEKYTSIRFNGIYSSTDNNLIAFRNNGYIYVKNGSSTNQPSGNIIYDLATPTEEQTTNTYPEIQDIDDFGTQEFLYDSDIDIPVPQGNDFFYPVDYKAFIDSLGGRDDIEYAADQVVSQAQLTQALSTFLSSIQGYDATKTQTLKNVSGVFQWVDD